MSTKLGTRISSVVMGLLFIIPGMMKTVKVNANLYKEMLKTFKNFTQVSPLQLIGVNPPPYVYMQSIGVIELVLGTTLIVGGATSRKIACLGLMLLMLLTAASQFRLDDYMAMIVPSGYFALLSWVFISIEKLERQSKGKTKFE